MSRDYIPSTMGLTTTISSNLGEVNSRGVDFSLDYNKAFDSGLILSGRGNFTYATNEVLVNGEPDYTYDYLSRIGYPVNQLGVLSLNVYLLIKQILIIHLNSLTDFLPLPTHICRVI